MRATSTGALLVVLGLTALAGCYSGRNVPTRPEKPVQGWVTLEVPGMT
jgi:hypothetical protein